MVCVAGLDLSLTNAGVVVLTNHSGVACPTILDSCGRDGRDGETYKQRSRRIRKQVYDVMQLLEPAGKIDLAVIEGPIYGTDAAKLPSYFDRAGLWHGIYGALDARNVPVAVIPPTQGHIFTTGKGSMPKDPRAFKPLIMSSVQKLLPGHNIANHDIADAAGLALMGAMSLGIKMPFRAQRWQHEAVYNAVWPHGKQVRYG